MSITMPGRQNPLNPFRALLAALAVLWILGPTAAAASVYDLGGACHDGRQDGADLDESINPYRQVARAEKNADWARAIRYQKRLVRAMCDNPHRWFSLAEFHRRAGEDTAALRVMTRLYRRDPNAVEARLARDDELILAVRESRPFQGSKLQAMMERNRRALRERRADFRDTLASLPASRKPPERYVARGACPFECCVYRTWSVHGPVTVYERPRADTVVGRVDDGDTVLGLTGSVYLKPRAVGMRVGMRLDRGRSGSRAVRAEPGEILFLLDYVGEGYSHVWYRGDTHLVRSYTFRAHCPRVNEGCRGEYLVDGGEAYHRDWWVKVRLPDGTVGWTNEVDPFGNLDACA